MIFWFAEMRQSALIWASRHSHDSTVKLMVDAGADFEFLIDAGADIEAKDDNG